MCFAYEMYWDAYENNVTISKIVQIDPKGQVVDVSMRDGGC